MQANHFRGLTAFASLSLAVSEGSGQQFSLLLIHPVFGLANLTTDEPGVIGVASCVNRIGEGVERALSQLPPAGLDLWLMDRSAKPREQLLYYHASKTQHSRGSADRTLPPLDGWRYTRDFEIGGRQFELIVAPTDERSYKSNAHSGLIALLLGLGLTALLAAYLALMLRRSRELIANQLSLQQQVDEREQVEQRLLQANDEFETLSRKDSLTGIANRRYFEDEWRRAVRHGTLISLQIADVDNFKRYNDRFGHPEGDRCLRKIAAIMSDELDRPGDLVARFGGEELALILPNSSVSGAFKVAEKIRTSVEAMPALSDRQAAAATKVTISFGYGTLVPTANHSKDRFIKAVDDALYRAKKRGRNQSVSIESVD